MTLPLLDPRNDLVFKMLFTNALPLSDLINAVRSMVYMVKALA